MPLLYQGFSGLDNPFPYTPLGDTDWDPYGSDHKMKCHHREYSPPALIIHIDPGDLQTLNRWIVSIVQCYPHISYLITPPTQYVAVTSYEQRGSTVTQSRTHLPPGPSGGLFTDVIIADRNES